MQRKIHPNYFGVVALVVVIILQEKILTQYNFPMFFFIIIKFFFFALPVLLKRKIPATRWICLTPLIPMMIFGLDATTLLIGAKGKLTEPDDTSLFLKASINFFMVAGFGYMY